MQKHNSKIIDDLQGLAVPIDDLIRDPRNARLHSDRNIAAIADSLARFGQRKPLVLNARTGVIEAGNGTLMAARELGWTHVAAVRVHDDDTTATGFALADNRSAELATWDDAQLAELLQEVRDEIPLRDLGFTDDELDQIISTADKDQDQDEQPEPEAAEPPATPVSQPGRVYRLGPHRVICGDSRDFLVWEALLAGERINLVVTSPPYAARRDYDASSGFKPIAADGYVDWWEPLQACAAKFLAADGSFMVNIKEHAEDGCRHLYTRDLVLAHVRRWGWNFIEEFCWERNGIPGSPEIMRRFKNQWEPVFHFARSMAFKFRPAQVMHDSANAVLESPLNPKLKDLTEAGRSGDLLTGGTFGEGKAYPGNRLPPFASSGNLHSAAFPVGLPEFFVRAFSDHGDLILDPFLGSGSSLIAAARTGRRGFGIELSPGYVDVIRKRWGDYARESGVDPGSDAL